MGIGIDVDLGKPLPLFLSTFNGDGELHPRAVVRDISGSEVAGSPFSLIEISGSGEYSSIVYTPTIEDTYFAKYTVYDDAGHSTESATHGRDQDVFHVTDLLGAVSRIAVAGAAINKIADSVIVTTGTPAGTVNDTFAHDNVYHQIAEDTDIDVYYEFVLPSDGVPTGVTHHGRLDRTGGAVSTINVQAWNWGSSAWEGVGILSSVNNSTALNDESTTFALLTGHVGTSGNLGKVRVRFVQTGFSRSEELFVDQLFISYAIVFRSVGYAGGKIWIDTINGTSGSTAFFHGVADNPVNNITDATALSTELGISRFAVSPSSVLAFSQSYDNYLFEGDHWKLDLNGQSITEATIIGAEINGTGSSATDSHFTNCMIQSASLPPGHFHTVMLGGRLALGVGDYHLDNCSSVIAGNNTPSIDFGVAVGVTNLNMRHYSGGVRILNMTALDKMSLEGFGQLKIDASCTGGAVALRGHFRVTDYAGDVVTITDDQLVDNIWEEVGSAHNTSGTMGWLQNQVVDTLVSGSGVAVNTSSIAAAVWDKLSTSHDTTGTMGSLQNNTETIRALMENNWEISGTQMIFYGDDGITPFRIFNLFDTEGDAFSSEENAPAERVLTGSLS